MTPSRQAAVLAAMLAVRPGSGRVRSLARERKVVTIGLDSEVNRLLTRVARAAGVSRTQFLRAHLASVLERHRPRS